LVASHVVSLPFYWVTDGFLNLRLINGSVFTNAYRKGLERAYGLAPNADHDEYVDYFEHEPDQFMNAQNGSVLFWRKASQTEELHFSHLREFALGLRWPITAVRMPWSMPVKRCRHCLCQLSIPS